jgi:cobalt/nickel transport protein
MVERRYLKAAGIILAAFAAGLVLFFMFSGPYGDGLESTMERGGKNESEPVYHAPLDYGGNYPAALFMGALGFFLVLGAVYLVGKLAGRRKK